MDEIPFIFILSFFIVKMFDGRYNYCIVIKRKYKLMKTESEPLRKTYGTFGDRDCDSEQRCIKDIEAAEALGWTDVRFVYDDVYGGLYLGGVNAKGEWGHVPRTTNLEK